ncbi:MAG: preprotein translocase subunit SecG [Proteobacteria bacterium]|nr:preprotein translocase subunit SecG [Pseudomonadota bacterium]MDA1071144.1 preprotein translocase subunit SecG [Pseudomonadota bacterium]
METILVVLHVLFATAIVALVLLQRSEGGGLGMGGGGGGGGGGMGGFMSARGTANLLTRATAIVATLFFLSSLTLTIVMSNQATPTSIVDTIPADGSADAPATEQTPAEPSVPAAE